MNKAKIGLEIHVQLNTKSKIFCSCATKTNNEGDDEPNSRCCAVCLGHPGSKPFLNSKVLEYGLKLAHALNCIICSEVIFSRKTYFYPDLSKNFQITQFEVPLGNNGYVKIGDKKIGIKRVHIEEDPASLVHEGTITKSAFTLIDYNRSGIPLAEIVTEPDIENAEMTREFMNKLFTILQYLEIFDPKTGIVKADVNVSIPETGYVRVEIKNVSGFKEIENCIEYEVLRQLKEHEEGKIVVQETRAWNPEGYTESLREKESEEDYGYIFEPDLIKVEINEKLLEKIKSEIPIMPDDKAKMYVEEGVEKTTAEVIANNFALSKFFDEIKNKLNPAFVANLFRKELLKNINNYNKSFEEIDKKNLLDLLILIYSKKISEKVGRDLFELLVKDNINIKEYVKQKNLEVITDTNEIERFCEETIKENPKAVLDYKNGEEKALNFLVGTVIRKTKGKVSAAEVKELLKKKLAEKN